MKYEVIYARRVPEVEAIISFLKWQNTTVVETQSGEAFRHSKGGAPFAVLHRGKTMLSFHEVYDDMKVNGTFLC